MKGQTTSYEPRSVKRRRRTNAELAALDDIIYDVCATEAPITLRGVYYRAVSRDAIEKTEAGYRVIMRQLLKLRRAGTVPYHWVTDGTRLMRKPSSWSNVDIMLRNAASSYRRALWEDQDTEIIVLSEKDAISGVIYPVTSEWDVELGITRGYSSETFVHSIAETVQDNTNHGKKTVLYNLGDHDPEGIDAWRDFETKVRGFVPGANLECERLAVTAQQIEDWNLPLRPTKRTSSRAAGFKGGSVEVDAVPTPLLRETVEKAITKHIDPVALSITRAVEESERDMLTRIAGDGS